MSSRRRRAVVVAWGVGVVAVVVTVVFAVGWRDIATRYHAWRIGSDPSLFDEYLHAPKNSPREAGFRRYLKTAPGRERFIAEYVDFLTDDEEIFGERRLEDRALTKKAAREALRFAMVVLELDRGEKSHRFLWRKTENFTSRSSVGGGSLFEDDRAAQFGHHLGQLLGARVELADFRPLVFQITKGRDARRHFLKQTRDSELDDLPALLVIGETEETESAN